MKVNPLSKDFTLKSLIKYTLPSIIMMIFMSTYTIIDGIFVSNLVGEEALAAVNLIMPIFGIIMAISLMFAAGGNAIISRYMGQGKLREAREFLSVLYVVGTILGLFVSLVSFIFPDQLLGVMGISDTLYPLARTYLLSIAGFAMPIFFQVYIQTFMLTAGKPTLGLWLSVIGGLINVILDYVLISPNMFNLGIAGAGIATGIGNAVPGIIGLFYFMFNRKGVLYFVKPKFDFRVLGHSIFNGSSELVGNIAVSITTLMFNFILLQMVGDSGVAAISVILYIQMFQNAIYFGFTMGISPIIGYKYGEENHLGLHKIIQQSFKIIAGTSVLVIIFTIMLADQAIGMFIASSSSTFALAKNGLLLFLPAYLFMGFNIFFSALFTSLSNGKVSAIISVLRSLVFIVIALLILPNIFDLNGVWLAIPVAELMSIFVCIYFYQKGKVVYKY